MSPTDNECNLDETVKLENGQGPKALTYNLKEDYIDNLGDIKQEKISQSVPRKFDSQENPNDVKVASEDTNDHDKSYTDLQDDD